ncbi:hypothetical protein IMCC26207_104188 [Actinobacteria bacterium IMCC26207]|nr:hypothetical protein IMCC26207_104188 [Actinobacteria bacterium IMCC26207]
MRKSVGAVVVVAALLGVVFAVVPPVGATAPVIPPGVEPGCGAASGNYAACVTVVNATRGFASPGVVNNASGLAFNARFAQTSRQGGLSGGLALGSFPTTAQILAGQGEALAAAAQQLEAGLGWVAWRCRIAAPFMHGCRTEVTTQVEQSQNPQVLPANQPMQAEVLRRDPNAVVTASGRVERRTDITDGMRNCDNTSRYVLCRHLGNQGPRDYTRFNFELTNETVMVNVTNFLPHRLELANKQWGQAIVDQRGVTPDTRLANGELNSARSIAPYNDALPGAPVGQWGGLRPLSAENTHIHLNYRITGAGQYTNQLVGVDLQFELVGEGDRARWRPVEDPARACRLTGPGAHPRCRVAVASVGGNTQLDVSLENFN